ncbi:MAG: hypothetical protein QOH12_2520 [Solirubrobacteraceae bacterium]|jgi:hypothetical protein|nr:hypothetical protein [Solirubrobacteraceae bacterium]
MTDSNPIRAKGPTDYDLGGMPDEDFERMVGRLVLLEFPDAIPTSKTKDGGADVALPKVGGGYSRCWQAKHFRGAVDWRTWRKSLADARKHWRPDRYTFCIPRELTVGEQKTFDRHFCGPDVDIAVDHWNGEALQGRLVGSPEGRRVARTFFEHVELDRESMNRSIEVGGRLDTPEDALDRLANVGDFLKGQDAYFFYPGATTEVGGPVAPMAPGTVMSVIRCDGSVASRIDIVPRDAEAMELYGPTFVLQPTEGEEGERAAALLQAALAEGRAVDIDAGIDIIYTRMPPAYTDMVGERFSGRIELGAPELAQRVIPPWRARLRAVTDEGDVSLDVVLASTPEVPTGWAVALTGQYGSLGVTAMLRRTATGVEVRLNFRHARNEAPVREQLAALRFVKAISGVGEIVVSNHGGFAWPEMRIPNPSGPFPTDSQRMLAFLEDVRTVEEWADIECSLPETVTGQAALEVATVAARVRNGGRSVTWAPFTITLPEENVPRLHEAGAFRVEQTLALSLFGNVVDMGYSRLTISGYTVTSEVANQGQPGYVDVTIGPSSPAGAELFEELVREATPVQRPPAPPRKTKGNKGGRRKKSRNKRRR